jgi:hypothetical protein
MFLILLQIKLGKLKPMVQSSNLPLKKQYLILLLPLPFYKKYKKLLQERDYHAK